jgi:hypothetical protein
MSSRFVEPLGVELFPAPLPSPKQFLEWREHPATVAFLQLLNAQVYEDRKNATTTEQMENARGLSRVLLLLSEFEQETLKPEPDEGGEEEDGRADSG